MERRLIQIGETIAYLTAEASFFSAAETIIRTARREISRYIRDHPWFWATLEPLAVENPAPEIVRRMVESAELVNVGPMAAVAGAIAQTVVEQLVELGASHVIFDNGGDIAMFLDHPIVAGVYTGRNGVAGIGLLIDRTQELLGLCTSSASVGPSLSLGVTDASTVFARDAILADAAATALGNLVSSRSPDCIESALRQVQVAGVKGAMVILGDTIGIGGDLPELVHAQVAPDLIAKMDGGWCY